MQPESIVVASCERKKPYIDGCLRSMLKDDSVSRVSVVVCGGSDPAYLAEWGKNERIEIVAPSEAERERAAGKNPVQRTIFTTARALRHGTGPGPTLFFEDDAVFGKDWLVRARVSAHKLEKRHGEKFLMALYCAYRLPRDKQIVPYHPSNFYGNVGLWFPSRAAAQICERMERAAESEKFEACDIIVKGWMSRTKTLCYAMSPSVVNHMGDESTRGRTITIRAQSYLG